MDSLDCLPILLSMFVFYFLVFWFFHFLLVGTVQYIKLTRSAFNCALKQHILSYRVVERNCRFAAWVSYRRWTGACGRRSWRRWCQRTRSAPSCRSSSTPLTTWSSGPPNSSSQCCAVFPTSLQDSASGPSSSTMRPQSRWAWCSNVMA